MFEPAVAQEDLLAKARALATSNHRREALEMLSSHLNESPRDVDARLLYGLVLSWEGRWGDAREALQQVLDQTPGYIDAAIALTNVELWSRHPQAGDELTRKYVAEMPNHVELLLARARVLRALKQRPEEQQVLHSVLQVDPHNSAAEDMQRAMREESSAWDSSFSVNTIAYNDHTSPWIEQQAQIRRGANAGSVIFRFSRAYRFGYKSNLAEVDWYPHIRPGTYAYLNFGYSPEAILYPRFRAGAELFQSLGHGYEASAGMRRLQFTSTRINVYTASLGRYHKNWYISGRTFVVPGDPKPSVSVQGLVRHYFGDGERYIGIRAGRGAAPFEIRSTNEVGVLDSASYSGEMYWRFGRHFLFGASGGAAGEDRIERVRLLQYFASISVYLRL
jgi:YaiO family outer membrane protein